METRDAGQHPIVHMRVPKPPPNVNDAAGEKLCIDYLEKDGVRSLTHIIHQSKFPVGQTVHTVVTP